LLQRLLVCACCGYAYYGKPIRPSARKGNPRSYAYYRCIGSDASRFGGVRLCWNKQLRTDLVDEAVWNEVCKLLEDPSRLEQEYRQCLLAKEHSTELTGLEASLGRLRQGIARLIDSYAEGMIDKAEFEPRITRMRERITQLEEQVRQIQDEAGMEHELRLILARLETFASKVKEGLAEADWLTRRELIRTLVKRVEVDQEHVNVIFRIGPTTPSTPSDHHLQSLPHCGGRVQPHTQQYLPEQVRSICRNSSDAKVQSGEAQETQSCVSTDWECHRPCQAKRKQASTSSVRQATAQ